MKEKLLKRLPKKYYNRMQDFVVGNGLIDNCKYYILLFANDYTWNGYESLPCKSITEAVTFVREAERGCIEWILFYF